MIGNILNKHNDVLFLNEPRSIWLYLFPECDVWSFKSLFNKSNVTLSPSLLSNDIESKTKQIKGFYSKLLNKYNKKIIVDKFPSHSFRIDLLQKMFPKCKIIHIKRDGFDVSKSIAKFSLNAWYGVHEKIKWNALKSFIIKNNLIQNFEQIIDQNNDKKEFNMNEMGLIEWTASILSIKQNINLNDNDNYFEIKYEDITNRNDKNKCYQTIKSLFEFIVDKNNKDTINDGLIYESMDIIKTKDYCCKDTKNMNGMILFKTKLLLEQYKSNNHNSNNHNSNIETDRQSFKLF